MVVLNLLNIEIWKKENKETNKIDVFVKYPSMHTITKYSVKPDEVDYLIKEIEDGYRYMLELALKSEKI